MNWHTKILFLLTSLFAIAWAPLSAEIYEIRLTIEGFTCPYCARGITYHLKQVKGIEESRIWVHEGLALIGWKNSVPFQSSELSKTFFKTQFLLREVAIDVEGVLENTRGTTLLRSQPEGSTFYIENREKKELSKLEDGAQIRCKGIVLSQRGFNYLFITHVLPPNTPVAPQEVPAE